MTHAGTLPRAGTATFTPAPVITVEQWIPWALFTFVVAYFLLYMVGLDQGATALIGGEYVHELVHDARHALGFPCH